MAREGGETAGVYLGRDDFETTPGRSIFGARVGQTQDGDELFVSEFVSTGPGGRLKQIWLQRWRGDSFG